VSVIKRTPLGEVRRSLQVAAAVGLPWWWGLRAGETSVGLAGQLAFAGALPVLGFACGLDTLSLLDGDVVTAGESLRSVEGYLLASRTPARTRLCPLDAYALTDPERVRRWWLDRLTRVCTELNRIRDAT